MSAPHKHHVAKKPRIEQKEPELPPPTVSTLFRVPAGLDAALSPGAVHASRIVAVHGADPGFASVFASGAGVFWHSAAPGGGMRGHMGKEAVMIPERAAGPAAARLAALRHCGEVQGLALRQLEEGQVMLATVDCYGCGTLSRVSVTPEAGAAAEPAAAGAPLPAAAAAEVVAVERIEPADAMREGGWAGVAFSRAGPQPDLLATARGFARDVALYSGARRVRALRACAQPYALTFLPPEFAGGGGGGDCLALAEMHVVSIWDVRAGERGGCVQRVPAAMPGGAVFALDWCSAQGGLLGAAGSERAVQMIDPRKWRCSDKWSGAARQAIHHISFLESNPGYVCASGLDSEVVCGCWGKPPPRVAVRPYGSAAVHQGIADPALGGGGGGGGADDGDGARAACAFSFRGDARWLGVSKAAGADALAGLAASGAVVYARVAEQPARREAEGGGGAAEAVEGAETKEAALVAA